MIDLRHSDNNAPDPCMVEALTNAAIQAMERAAINDITTSAEVMSASFTILDRTLRAFQNLQAPEDRIFNTKEVARVLQEFLINYGSLPN